MDNKLLTREQFKIFSLERHNYHCVICRSRSDLCVHHILERRLFEDHGYYLNNGATLCPDCHIKAEQTLLSIEDIRNACGILEKNKVLPDHLYRDQIYDKWANPILPNGTRLRGELFDDPSVQNILDSGNVLNLFTKYIKYPRTYHLPWSNWIKDDRVLESTKSFEGKEVVVTIKMDGENTTMYNDYIHARSLNDKKHWSKSWIKNFHSKISQDIPDSFRLVVENLYAKHSILYDNLESYCYGISVWENLNCLDWDSTCDWFNIFGIPQVEILYRGIYNEDLIKNHLSIDSDNHEGYVVRLTDRFHYKDFKNSVAKYVRPNHVSSNDHWFYGNSQERNLLK